MESLRGRTALVTGASGGLGKHIARALAREGMNVIVFGRRQDALQELAVELTGLGTKSEALAADLVDLEQAEALIDRAEQAIGALDLVIHNAGIELASSFTRYTREELTSMISLNLTAPLLMTHRVLPGMVERPGMYQRMVDEGLVSNRLMGTTTTEKIAGGVVRAIRRDLPEVIETGTPVRRCWRSRRWRRDWPNAPSR